MSWVRDNLSKKTLYLVNKQNRAQQFTVLEHTIQTPSPELKTKVVNPLTANVITRIQTPSPELKTKVDNPLTADVITTIHQKVKSQTCLEYIDAILYINLEHRQDRKEHCLNEIKKIDPTFSKTHRIEAVCNKSNGALGCSLSHISALELFIKNPSWNSIMLLEDDFTFVSDNTSDINTSIIYLLKNAPHFDMLLLGVGIDDLKTDTTSDDLILKVNSSQTTSGYIVTRQYVYTLLANYIKSSNKLKTYGLKTEWCLDQFWKRIMPFGNWYTLKNRIGYQYGNVSDIENGHREYRC